MTIYELHLAFVDAVDKITSSSYPDIPIEQRDRFLNLGAERFVKQRYGGTNPKGLGVEEIQKRTDDLSSLVQYQTLQPLGNGFFSSNTFYSLYYALPQDYWFSLIERVNLSNPKCPDPVNAEVKVARHNDVNYRLRDPFNKPKGNRVFRVMVSGGNAANGTSLIELFLDRTVTANNYQIGYIGQPQRLRGQTNLNQQPIANLPFTYQTVDPTTPNFWRTQEYWFNNQTHQEIVDLAVKAAIETIEHPRYQSYAAETSTHE